MSVRCPRCLGNNRKAARFCARCGLSLEAGLDGGRSAGRISHPAPLPPPAGSQPVRDALQMHYRVESAWGGTVWGVEGVGVILFNAGYPLRSVVLSLTARSADGADVLRLERTLADLPRGRETRVDIASYELSAPVREVLVSLVSAEFGPEE